SASMVLWVMGFMNAALGFLFLAIVYLSSLIRAVWVTPHGRYGQRESASISGKCQPPSNGFFALQRNYGPAGGSLRYNRKTRFPDNFLSPRQVRGNRQKTSRHPR